MAMTGGTVTVADNETHTGSGLALAIYLVKKAANADQLEATSDRVALAGMSPALTEVQKQARLDESRPTRAASRLALLRSWAREASVLGQAIVDYLTAHAEVSLSGVVATVGAEASVGRVPDPATAGAPIDGPAAAVKLPVTKGGSAKLGLA